MLAAGDFSKYWAALVLSFLICTVNILFYGAIINCTNIIVLVISVTQLGNSGNFSSINVVT